MLGFVFTEFFDLVASAYSPGMLDGIIEDSGVDTDYAATGSYPYQDMAALILALSQRSGEPAAALMERFGRHLFGRFRDLAPGLVAAASDSLSLLEGLDQSVHAELRQRHPQAELPGCESERLGPDALRLTYRSRRCLAPLALGLIRGCADHFGEALQIDVDGRISATTVSFTIRRQVAS